MTLRDEHCATSCDDGVTVSVLRQEIEFEFWTVIRRERKLEKHEIIDKNRTSISLRATRLGCLKVKRGLPHNRNISIRKAYSWARVVCPPLRRSAREQVRLRAVA